MACFYHCDDSVQAVEHHRGTERHARLYEFCSIIDRDDCSEGTINRSPFRADHVVDARWGAVSESARITIKAKRKKSVRRIPTALGNEPMPISRDPA